MVFGGSGSHETTTRLLDPRSRTPSPLRRTRGAGGRRNGVCVVPTGAAAPQLATRVNNNLSYTDMPLDLASPPPVSASSDKDFESSQKGGSGERPRLRQRRGAVASMLMNRSQLKAIQECSVDVRARESGRSSPAAGRSNRGSPPSTPSKSPPLMPELELAEWPQSAPPTPPTCSGLEEESWTQSTSLEDFPMVSDPSDSADLRDLNFNVFRSAQRRLRHEVTLMFRLLNLPILFNIPSQTLLNFVDEVLASYHDNPYHNARHALDVTQCVFHLLVSCGARAHVAPLDQLAVLTAALCHDLKHPGTNNDFQAATLSPLSILYNDMSVLEQHHAACTWRILQLPHCNIFKNLSPEQFGRVRRIVLGCILGTDMSRHRTIVQDFTARYVVEEEVKRSSGCSTPIKTPIKTSPTGSPVTSPPRTNPSTPRTKPPPTTEEDLRLLLTFMLKCADISNVTRPTHIAAKWTTLVLNEFLQGDAELALGLPVTPMMDRRLGEGEEREAKMVLGFIDFVALPAYKALAAFLPQAQPMVEGIQRNRTSWIAKQAERVRMVESKSRRASHSFLNDSLQSVEQQKSSPSSSSSSSSSSITPNSQRSSKGGRKQRAFTDADADWSRSSGSSQQALPLWLEVDEDDEDRAISV